MQLLSEVQWHLLYLNIDQRTLYPSRPFRRPAKSANVLDKRFHRHAPIMALCHACQGVPFRSMFRLLEGDETTHDGFEWFFPPDSVSKYVYFRWHKSVSDLRDSARSCPFFILLHSRIEEDWRFKASVVEDTRMLWLEADAKAIGNPCLAAGLVN
jgi:hypothetical protein